MSSCCPLRGLHRAWAPRALGVLHSCREHWPHWIPLPSTSHTCCLPLSFFSKLPSEIKGQSKPFLIHLLTLNYITTSCPPIPIFFLLLDRQMIFGVVSNCLSCFYFINVLKLIFIGVLLLWRLRGKESACQCRSHSRCGFDSWIRKSPWRREWQPTPVLVPEKFHGQRSLAGYSPWGCKELDITERLSTNAQSCFTIC